MTTAHRPTFKPALGGSEQGGNKMMTHTRSFSARELPAYLELKVRKPGQGTQEEISKINFKEDLVKREVEGTRQKELKALGVSETSLAVTAGDKDIAEPQILKKFKPNPQEDARFPQDANDEMFMKSSDEEEIQPKKNGFQSSGEENRDEDSDSDDDDEELLREFQKIKEQREIEERRRFQEKQEEIDRNKEEEILKGNPLVAGEDYSLKKKWFEDTIFRNQSRLEKKDKQRFINDAVRSDFHRKFLNKYILM